MFRKNTKDEDTNFWLSYADLMAGLLFVFILLIGAIVVKSIVLKSNLESKENSLESSLQLLLLRDTEVQRLQALLSQKTDELSDKEKEFQNTLELTAQEIINLNSVLLSQTMHIDDLNATILALSGELVNKEDALTQNQNKYDILIAKLQEQKAKIKSLTGIKIKVIAELKQNLGKNIQIDPISGSLRLSSNILFDKGSAELKESSKHELKKVFINYVGALTSNKNIKNQLDKIIIEGHTDSDGTYLYNLDLSQKRAYAVMRYLLTLDFTEKNSLKPLLLASGRADQDTIKDKKAQEDKELSRRIEIKFTLKNDDALHEIERILDYE
ncbi:MAG: OmpA family protein [Sulfurimonas sp.]